MFYIRLLFSILALVCVLWFIRYLNTHGLEGSEVAAILSGTDAPPAQYPLRAQDDRYGKGQVLWNGETYNWCPTRITAMKQVVKASGAQQWSLFQRDLKWVLANTQGEQTLDQVSAEKWFMMLCKMNALTPKPGTEFVTPIQWESDLIVTYVDGKTINVPMHMGGMFQISGRAYYSLTYLLSLQRLAQGATAP